MEFEVSWCSGIVKKEEEHASSRYRRTKKLQTLYQPPDPIVPLARAHHRIQHINYLLRNKARLQKSPHHVRAQYIYIYIYIQLYSRTLSSLEDNLKMVSKDRNMQLSSIVIKTSQLTQLCLTTYPFPIDHHSKSNSARLSKI